MCNKYVSSAAALAGKKLVSCEEITNTAMAFMATLENIKISGDQSNISGVNQSILHGYNYSPLDAPFPGWVRYGAYFNERNTWWPYFKKWADYKARISYLLQSATPQANVAILQPLIDLWLKKGPQRDPFPKEWYPEYQNNLWEAVNQNGGGCDYVSENIIKNSRFENGQMIYNQRSYDTLLLPEIETLDIDTAKAIADFAKAGGKIVYIAKTPFKSVSYENIQENDATIKRITSDVLSLPGGNAVEYPAPNGDVIKWYGKMQQDLSIRPYVQFDQTHKFLNQSSYQVGGKSLFFIANASLSEHISVEAEFRVADKLVPWLWDAETGKRLLYPTNGALNKIKLELPRSASVLIMFDEKQNGEFYQTFAHGQTGAVIEGSWLLKLSHLNGKSETLELTALEDLTKIDQTKNFAGEVLYEKSIDLDPETSKYIDLGNVQGVSELTLNGQNLGVKWYGDHIYDIQNTVQKGSNELSIKVTTITGNYLKGLSDNEVAQTWTKHQDYYPMGIMGPIKVL